MKLEYTAIHLYVSTLFTWSYAKMTFFGHPEVADYYMRLKLDFRGDDPFDVFNRYQRKRQCDSLLAANFYSHSNGPLIPNRDSPPQGRTVQNIQTISLLEQNLHYTSYSVLIGGEIVAVKAFPCVISFDIIILLTYGFDSFRRRMFVLTKMALMMADVFVPLRIIGILEANPLLEWNHQFVHFRFSKSYVKTAGGPSTSSDGGDIMKPLVLSLGVPLSAPEPLPPDMDLGLSSEFQYFRLCSSVANEIGNDPKFKLDIRAYNYVHSMAEVREQAKAILDQNGKFLSYAHVLPCAINRPWDEPQFYLLRDRYDLKSVFVFSATEDETGTYYGETLRLEGVVNEVCALTDT